MEAERTEEVLARAEGKLLLGASLAVFLSFQLSNSPLYLLLLLCAGGGVLCAYLLFRILPKAPNFLPHIKHPSRIPTSSPKEPLPLLSCRICSQLDCRRHDTKKKRIKMNPWDGLTLPCSIDTALSEILEIVMQRYVYSWHRHLAPASESIEDEMRVTIRHAAAILLYRAQMIDIPLLISSKFLQPIASHIHFYTKARGKLPVDATVASIEAAVFKEYGSHTHTAMRGRTGNIRYFRHLARALMPLLLPNNMLQSKMMCSLVQELFASKVFVPAMNFAAKPDFINKLLLIVFDKNSRLERVFGPPSRDVFFLSKWASSRSRHSSQSRPLDLPLPELLDPQHHLYTFVQFMKSLDDICILQVYLTLNDLKQDVSTFDDENQAASVIAQVDSLYQTYLIPSSPSYIQLDPTEVAKIAIVLMDGNSTSMKKCEELKRLNVFGRLKGFIYNELLMKIYYPQFLHSYEFYEFYLGKKTERLEESVKSKGDKWRQKTKRLKKYSQPSVDSMSGDPENIAEATNEEGVANSKSCQVPVTVQIVDAEAQLEGIRPYTNFVILTKWEGDTKFELVKRRYKEFVVLDTKLRQFHGDISVPLPSKKAFRNMEKAFIDARCKELEQYLSLLITYRGVLDSQILASFLSSSSDSALFLPDTVTEKMIKAVPSILKRDKIQHLDELLQTLLQVTEVPNKQPSPQTIATVTAESQVNDDIRERYLEAVADDLSDSGSNRYNSSAPIQEPPTKPLQMKSVMDLLLFVSISVYHVSPIQLTLLMLTKLLTQQTIEALAYNFVAGKVELMTTEAHVIRLIHIFRDNLFFSKDSPRTEDDIRYRFQETVERLLGYPNPIVIGAIGEQRFQKGTALIIEALQCGELNKYLFFKLLDVILLELFPEIGVNGEIG